MAIVRTDIRRDRDVTINDPEETTIGTSAVENPGDYNQNTFYELALMQNVGATDIYLLYGTGDASTSNYHVKATPGTQVDLNDIVGARISVISSAVGGKIVFTLATLDTSHTNLPSIS